MPFDCDFCVSASWESTFRGDSWREGHRSRRKVALRVAGAKQGPEAKRKRLSVVLPPVPAPALPARRQPAALIAAADAIVREVVADAVQEQHCQQAARLRGRLPRSAGPLRDPGGCIDPSPQMQSAPFLCDSCSGGASGSTHLGSILPH